MTTFPEFRCGGWPLQYGDFPASDETTISGKSSFVRYSSDETGRSTTLQFTLTQAEFLTLNTHAEDHGNHRGFDFTTTTLPASYTPAGHLWYYVGAPAVEDLHADFFVVTCSFVSRYVGAFTLPAEVSYVVAEPVETVVAPAPSTPTTPSLTIVNATGSAATVIPSSPNVAVGGLDGRSSWEYSANGGSTWTAGRGSSLQLPAGTYAAGAVLVRQVAGAVVGASATNALPVIMPPPAVAASALAVGAGATVTGTLRLPAVHLVTRVTATLAGWLTVYSSAAALAADAARLRATRPPQGAGILYDPVFVLGGLDIRVGTETGAGSNGETPQTGVFPFRFRNDGTVGELILTVYYETIRGA